VNILEYALLAMPQYTAVQFPTRYDEIEYYNMRGYNCESTKQYTRMQAMSQYKVTSLASEYNRGK